MALRLLCEPLCHDYDTDCPISASREYQMACSFLDFKDPFVFKLLGCSVGSFKTRPFQGLLSELSSQGLLRAIGFDFIYTFIFIFMWHLQFTVRKVLACYSLMSHYCLRIPSGGKSDVFMRAGVSVSLRTRVSWRLWGPTSGVVLPQASLPLVYLRPSLAKMWGCSRRLRCLTGQ